MISNYGILGGYDATLGVDGDITYSDYYPIYRVAGFNQTRLNNFRRNPDKTYNLLFEPDETITIPSVAPYVVRLAEVPDNGTIQSRPIITDFTELWNVGNLYMDVTEANMFWINYSTGDIIFNEANAGEIIHVSYQKKGTMVNADHLNYIADFISLMGREDEMLYAKRTDFYNDDTIFKGEAEVGTLDSEALWRIHRLIISDVDGDVTEEWAEGTGTFDKIWNNRLDYTYS